MTTKTILIIGSGVSGLCTGIYGQMNGYQTCILEQHTIPGGLVTAWMLSGLLPQMLVVAGKTESKR